MFARCETIDNTSAAERIVLLISTAVIVERLLNGGLYDGCRERPYPTEDDPALRIQQHIAGSTENIEIAEDHPRVRIVPIQIDHIHPAGVFSFDTAHGSCIIPSGASPVGVDVQQLDLACLGNDRDILQGIERFRAATRHGHLELRASCLRCSTCLRDDARLRLLSRSCCTDHDDRSGLNLRADF